MKVSFFNFENAFPFHILQIFLWNCFSLFTFNLPLIVSSVAESNEFVLVMSILNTKTACPNSPKPAQIKTQQNTLLHGILGRKKLQWKLASCKNYSVIQFRAAARTYVWLNSSLQNRCSIINFPVFLTKYVECRNCAAVPNSLQISPVLSYLWAVTELWLKTKMNETL